MENKKGKSPNELTTALNSVTKKAEREPKLMQLQADKQTLTYEDISEKPAEIHCRNGSVFGMNQSPINGVNLKCRKYNLFEYHDLSCSRYMSLGKSCSFKFTMYNNAGVVFLHIELMLAL